MRIVLLLSIVVLGFLSTGTNAQQGRLCLDNICIGDDVDQLGLEWVKVEIDYKTKRTIESQLANLSIDELYYDYNEKLITDQKMLEELAPYVITLQKFDQSILDKLAKVKAICTPLSLTGEVKDDILSEKLFVTFRVVADNGGRGRLRVVQLEKEYKIYPPHIRPTDKKKHRETFESLQSQFPGIVEVRDIDARAANDEIAFAYALLGFRFFSDSRNPLIFRLRDRTDLESIEFDENKSASCPAVE